VRNGLEDLRAERHNGTSAGGVFSVDAIRENARLGQNLRLALIACRKTLITASFRIFQPATSPTSVLDWVIHRAGGSKLADCHLVRLDNSASDNSGRLVARRFDARLQDPGDNSTVAG
jgi:hypothetical protein